MKKAALIATGILLMSVSAWAATDYSAMSTEELSKIRGTLQSATEEERNAFRNEWQNRVQTMTAEERQQFMGPQAKGTGKGQGKGMGKGMGKGKGKGMNN